MPANPDHKIAILTGSSNEFFRWQTATQTSHEMVHRVIDGETFDIPGAPLFISLLCLPLWRDGYMDPDAMLIRVRAGLLPSVRSPVPPPIPGTDGSTEGTGILESMTATRTAAIGALRAILDDAIMTGDTRAGLDRRTQSDVLASWGVSTDVPRYVPSAYLDSLVAMMRLADSRGRPPAYFEFIGFYLQLLTHRYGILYRVGAVQSPTAIPRMPNELPFELLERFPQRLVMEELRAFSNDVDWARFVGHGDGVRLLMEIYRLRQMERENEHPEAIRHQRLHVAADIERIRNGATRAFSPDERARILQRVPPPLTQPPSADELERGWFLNNPPPLIDRPPRTVPPPIERRAPREAVRYVPGTLANQVLEEMARNERARRRQAIGEATAVPPPRPRRTRNP